MNMSSKVEREENRGKSAGAFVLFSVFFFFPFSVREWAVKSGKKREREKDGIWKVAQTRRHTPTPRWAEGDGEK